MTTKSSPPAPTISRKYPHPRTLTIAQWTGYWILKLLFWTVFRGRRVLPPDLILPDGGIVMVSNHCKFYDAFLYMGALPPSVFRRIQPAYYMIGNGYMGHPIAGQLGRLVGAFPAHEGLGYPDHGLGFSHRALDAGESVMIFPEGKRAYTGRLPAKPGVARLAAREDVTVWPMHIAWSKRWIGWQVSVKFGYPQPMTKHTAEEILDAAYQLGD